MDRIALKSGLWLMVADGEKALFLKNEGDTTYPNFEVVREIGQSNELRKKLHQEVTDRIVGEIPNVTVYGGKGGPKVVDDIVITAELGANDGVNGIRWNRSASR